MTNQPAGNADTGGPGNNSQGQPNQTTPQQPLTFDTWIQGQDETVKGLLDGHISGLKNALNTERESRKGLEKQVRDLAGKAEKGSEAEKQLTALADQINQADQRTEFYEAAHAAGVTNLKLAYLAAREGDLFNKHGQVDFKALRERFPELFGIKPQASGNAGQGTNQPSLPAKNMNEFIRKAAGRT